MRFSSQEEAMYEMRPPPTAPGSFSDNPNQPAGEADSWRAATGLGAYLGGGDRGSDGAGGGDEQRGERGHAATAASFEAAAVAAERSSGDGGGGGGGSVWRDGAVEAPTSVHREALWGLPLFEIGKDFVLLPGAVYEDGL